MKNLIYIMLILNAFSCKKAASTSIDTSKVEYQDVNIADYKVEAVANTNWQRGEKRDTAGNLLEAGYFENGKKVGSWLLYEHDKKSFPSKLSNYKDGKLNGLHMQFNQGGQIEVVANYENNQLHGMVNRYRFARLLEETNYKNGKLDGLFNMYELTTGKLQTSAEYKDGVQDGFYRTYNTSTGKMTAEYMYKNGEKVSGGVVTQ